MHNGYAVRRQKKNDESPLNKIILTSFERNKSNDANYGEDELEKQKKNLI